MIGVRLLCKRVCFFNEGLVDPYDEPKEQWTKENELTILTVFGSNMHPERANKMQNGWEEQRQNGCEMDETEKGTGWLAGSDGGGLLSFRAPCTLDFWSAASSVCAIKCKVARPSLFCPRTLCLTEANSSVACPQADGWECATEYWVICNQLAWYRLEYSLISKLDYRCPDRNLFTCCHQTKFPNCTFLSLYVARVITS